MRVLLVMVFVISSSTGKSQISKVPLDLTADSIVWSISMFPVADDYVPFDVKTAFKGGKEIFSQTYSDDKQIKYLEYFTNEVDISLSFDFHGNHLNEFCIRYLPDSSSTCYNFNSDLELNGLMDDYEYLNGTEKVFYSSGALKKTQPLQDGIPHGTTLIYWESGVLRRTTSFNKGKPICDAEFDRSGVLMMQIIYLPDNVSKRMFYNEKGELAISNTFKGSELIESKEY